MIDFCHQYQETVLHLDEVRDFLYDTLPPRLQKYKKNSWHIRIDYVEGKKLPVGYLDDRWLWKWITYHKENGIKREMYIITIVLLNTLAGVISHHPFWVSNTGLFWQAKDIPENPVAIEVFKSLCLGKIK